MRVYTGEVLFIRIFAKTALGRAINFLCIALGIVRRVNRMFSQFSFNNLVLLLQFTVQLYFGNEKHDESRSRAINRFIGSPFNSRIDTVPRIFRLYKGSEMESEGPSETKSHPMKRQHLRKRTKLFQDRIGILIQSGAFGAMRSRAFRIDSTGIVRTRKMQRKRSHFLRCTYIVAFSLPTSLCSLSKENIIRNAAVVVGECTIKCTCSIQS